MLDNKLCRTVTPEHMEMNEVSPMITLFSDMTQGRGALAEHSIPAELRKQRLESGTKETAGRQDIRNAQGRFQKSAQKSP